MALRSMEKAAKWRAVHPFLPAWEKIATIIHIYHLFINPQLKSKFQLNKHLIFKVCIVCGISLVISRG